MLLVAILTFFEMTQRKFQGKVLSKIICALVKNLENVVLLHHMMFFHLVLFISCWKPVP
jgi:hypothetical protein